MSACGNLIICCCGKEGRVAATRQEQLSTIVLSPVWYVLRRKEE